MLHCLVYDHINLTLLLVRSFTNHLTALGTGRAKPAHVLCRIFSLGPWHDPRAVWYRRSTDPS